MFKYKQNLVYFQVVLLFSYIELTLIKLDYHPVCVLLPRNIKQAKMILKEQVKSLIDRRDALRRHL